MNDFVSFREILPADAHQILEWRRKSRVAEFLISEVDSNLGAQENWVTSSQERADYYHWLFSIHGTEAGILSIAGLDFIRGVASWGYYIGNDSFLGLGAIIPPYLYNWLFQSLNLAKVEVEVFSTNQVVLRMHSFHGYRRVPEKDREVVRGGRQFTLLAMELNANDWLRQRAMLKFVAEFPTTRWTARPSVIGLRA